MLAVARGFGLSCCSVVLAFAAVAHAQSLTVDPVWGDHMVLQRGKPATMQGAAQAGAEITVRFGEVAATARANADGRWRATLPAVPEGASGVLEVKASSGEAIRLKDVAAGDVFLCSGQSNMDLPVGETAYPRRTADEARGRNVRIMKVKRAASARRQSVVTPDIVWSHAGPESLSSFSAVCWHMARRLREAETGAPVGLIQASWGGTTIEDWLSPDTLAGFPAYAQRIERLNHFARDPAAATRDLIQATDAWAKSIEPDAERLGFHAFDHDDTAWPAIDAPGSWERSGVPALRSFDGVMWLRRNFDLTAAQAKGKATLRLGRIDERDRVWVNGKPVGAAILAGDRRSYDIPAGVLRAGRNTLAIRVVDERGAGGLTGKPEDLQLVPAAGDAVGLAGRFRYRTGPARRDWKVEPPFVSWAAPRGVSMLWNAMIAPLDGVSLKGVAWYQGESNTSEASAYGDLLGAWALSWRMFFNDPDLPMIVAQLPGFGARSPEPTDSEWARLREAQRLMAERDPRMGLAVLIDQGVAHDIHPAHKEIVGERMGDEMLRVAYGRAIPQAPAPLEAVSRADAIVVRFSGAGKGLVAMGSHDAAGFELCDSKGDCRFVPAAVEGDRVRLPFDAPATEVRYAWQGSPPVNLYGPDGLPVVPFRIVISPAQ